MARDNRKNKKNNHERAGNEALMRRKKLAEAKEKEPQKQSVTPSKPKEESSGPKSRIKLISSSTKNTGKVMSGFSATAKEVAAGNLQAASQFSVKKAGSKFHAENQTNAGRQRGSNNRIETKTRGEKEQIRKKDEQQKAQKNQALKNVEDRQEKAGEEASEYATNLQINADKDRAKATEGLSGASKFLADTAMTGGVLAADIGIGLLTGGVGGLGKMAGKELGGKALSKLGKGMLKSTPTSKLGKKIGLAGNTLTSKINKGNDTGFLDAMTFRAYGSGYNSAINDGATEAEATKYGVTTALKERLIEGAFSPSSKLMGAGFLDDTVKKLPVDKAVGKITKTAKSSGLYSDIASTMKKLGVASATEGLEEVVAEFIDPGIKKAVYQNRQTNDILNEIDKEKESYITQANANGIPKHKIDQTIAKIEAEKAKVKENNKIDWAQTVVDALYAGAIGTVLGGGVAGVDLTMTGNPKNITDNNYKKIINKGLETQESGEAFIKAATLTKKVEQGKKVDPREVEEIRHLTAQEETMANQDIANTKKAQLKNFEGIELVDGNMANTIEAKEEIKKDITKRVNRRITSVENIPATENAVNSISNLVTGLYTMKDFRALLPYQENNVARAVFKEATGLELPNTVQGTQKVLKEYGDNNFIKSLEAEKKSTVNQKKKTELEDLTSDLANISSYQLRKIVPKLEENGKIKNEQDRKLAILEYKRYNILGTYGESKNAFEKLLESDIRSGDLRFIDKIQANIAYTSGVRDIEPAKNTLPEEAQSAGKKDKTANTLNWRGKNQSKKIRKRKAEEGLYDERKTSKKITNQEKKFMKIMAEATGIKVKLKDFDKFANGYFSDDTITIFDNTDNPILSVFSHEFIHYLQKEVPISYNDFRDFVMDNYKSKDGQGYAKELVRLKTLYAKNNKKITEKEAQDEILADAAVTLFTDPKFAEKLAETNKSLADKIIKILKTLIANIKEAVKQYPNGQFMKDIGILEESVNMLVDIVNQVETKNSRRKNVHNANISTAEEIGSTEGKFSLKNANSGYTGYAMSNRATEAYANSEMPISKWNKSEIIREVKENYNKEMLSFDMELFRKLKVADLKEMLVNSSWHHTGKMFNKTDFYSLDYDKLRTVSNVDINGKLKEKKKKEEKKEVEVTAKFLEWSGSRKHPTATERSESGYIKGNTFYGENGTVKRTTAKGFSILDYKKTQDNPHHEQQNKMEQNYETYTSEAAKRFYEKNIGSVERSSSGGMYIKGQKPTPAEYETKAIEKGTQRLIPSNQHIGAFSIEEWNGEGWAHEKKYSLKDTFSKEFDNWYNGERISNGFFTIGRTSEPLRSIGVKDYKINWDKSKILKIMEKHPEMTREVIKQVPKALEEPVIVMQSKTRLNSIVILGEVYADGMPVLVSVQLNSKDRSGRIMNSAKISSAYGHSKLQKLINESKILYIDPNKKRTTSWSRAANRLQLPLGLTEYGSINKISYYENDVNPKDTTIAKAFEEAKSKAAKEKKFSLKDPIEETKNLIALHNLSERKLLDTIELGGIPMPSIAVTRADLEHLDFGDISVLFGKETIDPAHKPNKVYSGDAYTPTFPRISVKVNEAALDRVAEKVKASVPEEILESTNLGLDIANAEEKINRERGDIVAAYGNSLPFQVAFMKATKRKHEILRADGETLDIYATKKKMESVFSEEVANEYQKWLINLFEGVIEKKGIRNNKDTLTPQGNRRTFEATHDPYTLENVVKAMKREKEQAAKQTFPGIGTVKAAMAKKFKGLAEIREESRVLVTKERANKDIKEKLTKLSDKLYDIAIRMSKNGELKTETIEDISNVAAKRNDIEGVIGYFKEKTDYYNIDTSIAKDILGLKKELENLPKKYFEAKPQRVVHLNEIKQVVLPDNTTEKLIKALERESIPYVKYEAENENDRLEKVNENEDIRFSLKTNLTKEEADSVSYEALTSKPDMGLSQIEYSEYRNREKTRKIASENINISSKYGDNRIYVKDISEDVVFSKKAINHSLGRKAKRDYFLPENAGPLLKNAIRINYIKARKENAEDGFLLMSMGKDGIDLVPVYFVVERYRKGENYENIVNLVYSINGKKIGDPAQGSGGFNTSSSPNIKIAKLLEVVNNIYSDILSDSVNQHFNNTRKESSLSDSVKYSLKDTAEVKELKKEIMVLKKELGKVSTKNASPKQLNKYVNRLVKTYHSSVPYSTVEKTLNGIYHGIKTNATTEETFETLYGLAQEIVEQGGLYQENTEIAELKKNIRSYLKETAVNISEQDRADLKYYTNNKWADFIIKYGKYTNIKRNGMGFDSMLVEFEEIFPGIIDKTSMSPTSQYYAILEWLENAKAGMLETFNINSKDGQELVYFVAEDIFKSLQEMSPMTVIEDRSLKEREKLTTAFATKLKEVKSRHKKQLQEEKNKRIKAETEATEKVIFAKKVAKEEIERVKAETEQTIKAVKDKERTKAEFDLSREKEKLKKRLAEQKEKFNDAITNEKSKAGKKLQNQKTRHDDKITKTEAKKTIAREYNFLARALIKPTDTKHIPEELIKGIAEFLSFFNFETPGTARWEKMHGKPSNRMAGIRKLKDACIKIQNKNVQNDLGEDITELDIDPELVDYIELVSELTEGKDFTQLTVGELDSVSIIIKLVARVVRNSNKLFAESRDIGVEQLAFKTANEIREAMDHRILEGTILGRAGLRKAVDKFINLDNTQPLDFFIKTGSETLTEMWQNIRKGQDKNIENIAILKDRISELKNKVPKKELKKWTGNRAEAQTFNVSSGNITLTTGQVMSLWATMQREQGQTHILGQGIVASDVGLNVRNIKNEEDYGKKLFEDRVHVSKDDVYRIIATLTPEQRKMAKELQLIMNTLGSKWGNEVSEQLYGYKKFTEENYFPIQTSKMFTNERFGTFQNANYSKLKNMGFTKSTVDFAKNPIVIDDIFDVTAEHMNKMSNYNAFVLPLTDFEKVYNAKAQDGTNIKSVLESKYNQNYVEYINTLIKNVNGWSNRDNTVKVTRKLISNWKKAALGINGRVLIQQWTAMFRALIQDGVSYKNLNKALLDKVSFGGEKKFLSSRQRMWEHAPIALWKHWGFVQSDVAKSMKDIILDNKKLTDFTMGSYGMADDISWSVLFRATEYEIQDKHPGVKYESEEYWNLVKEKFNYIVDRTQVVDSPLHRSQLMRSDDTGATIITPFMSEPTKQLNIIMTESYLATKAGHEGNKKLQTMIIGKVVAATTITMIMLSISQSLIDALRETATGDEEKDEEIKNATYLEKVKTYTLDNLLENINPLGYFPIIKDVLSMSKGFNFKMPGYADIEKTFKAWEGILGYIKGEEQRYSLTYHMKNMVEGVGGMFGLPIKNVLREVEIFGRTMLDIARNENQASVWLNSLYAGNNKSVQKSMIMDNARQIMSGKDTKAYDSMVKQLMNMGMSKPEAKNEIFKKAERGIKEDLKNAIRDKKEIEKYEKELKAIGAQPHEIRYMIKSAKESVYTENLEEYIINKDVKATKKVADKLVKEGIVDAADIEEYMTNKKFRTLTPGLNDAVNNLNDKLVGEYKELLMDYGFSETEVENRIWSKYKYAYTKALKNLDVKTAKKFMPYLINADNAEEALYKAARESFGRSYGKAMGSGNNGAIAASITAMENFGFRPADINRIKGEGYFKDAYKKDIYLAELNGNKGEANRLVAEFMQEYPGIYKSSRSMRYGVKRTGAEQKAGWEGKEYRKQNSEHDLLRSSLGIFSKNLKGAIRERDTESIAKIKKTLGGVGISDKDLMTWESNQAKEVYKSQIYNLMCIGKTDDAVRLASQFVKKYPGVYKRGASGMLKALTRLSDTTKKKYLTEG